MKKVLGILLMSSSVIASTQVRATCIDIARPEELSLASRSDSSVWAGANRKLGMIVDPDGWRGQGYETPTDILRPFGKLVNSYFLLRTGLINARATDPFDRQSGLDPTDPYFSQAQFSPPSAQLHSFMDYLVLSYAASAFHDDRDYKFVGCDTRAIGYNSNVTAPIPLSAGESGWDGDVSLVCSVPSAEIGCSGIDANDQGLFTFVSSNANPAFRAAVIMHEMWHAWQIQRDISGSGPCGPRGLILWVDAGGDPSECTVNCGGHICPYPMGACPTRNSCDPYYYHASDAYDFYPAEGVPDMAQLTLADRRVRPPHFHTPYQVEFEYLCDLATSPNPTIVPYALSLIAEQVAESDRVSFLQPPPPFTCSRPGLFEPRPPAPGSCGAGGVECRLDEDCGPFLGCSGTKYCAGDCCACLPQ